MVKFRQPFNGRMRVARDVVNVSRVNNSTRDIMSAATKQYAWIISPTPSLDPARFLFQWLAVSLADIPLLVYQSPTESSTLEDLFQVDG